MTDSNKPSDDISADDLWAEAMNEQVGSSSSAPQTDDVFKSFDSGNVAGSLQDIELIMDIPVKLTVELGRTKIRIK